MAEVSPDKNSKGALRIGARLLRGAKLFRRGVTSNSQVKQSNQAISKSASRIKEDQRTINQENKKQRRIETGIREETERRRKSLELGSAAAVVSPVRRLVDNVVKKPLESLWNIIAAWATLNLPWIIKQLNIFQKKVRIFVAAIRSAVVTTGRIFGSLLNIGKAFVQNMLEFDFQDKSGRLQTSQSELETNLEDMNTAFSEMRNVWNREEQDLENILSSLDSGSTLQESLSYIFAGEDVDVDEPTTQPQTRMVGGGSGGGGSTSTSADSLFDIIASGEGDYNSVNRGNAGDTPGGAKSIFGKDLTDMTVGEVVAAQQKGAVFAVGKYQIIPSTMQDFLRNSDIKPTDKFDATTQEKFKKYVIDVKRPEVGRYLRGESNDRTAAAQGLAREFASIGAARSERIPGFAPAQRGDTLYGGRGNNRASIDPAEIEAALDRGRAARNGSTGNAPAQQPQPVQSGGGSAVVDEANVAADRNPTVGITSKYKSASRPGHRGIDIGTSGQTGWLVGLKLSGQVNEKGYEGGYGNFVGIYVPGLNKTFFFAHLKRSFVKKGQSYNGQAIGEIGNTGRSFGEHLHFEVHQGNTAGKGWGGNDLDPMPYVKYLSIGRKRTRATGNATNIESTAQARAQETTTTAASRRTNTNKGKDKTFIIRLPILMGSK